MKKIKNKKSLLKKKKILFIFTLAGLVALVLGVYHVTKTPGILSQSDPVASGGTEAFDLSPPSEEEVEQGDTNYNKTEPMGGEETDQTQPAQNQKSDLMVLITSAEASTVRAQVSGVVEDGGICTATYIKGSDVYKRTSTGMANVSYTQCQPIRPEAGKLTKGTWKVVVDYNSNEGKGSSLESAITIN